MKYLKVGILWMLIGSVLIACAGSGPQATPAPKPTETVTPQPTKVLTVEDVFLKNSDLPEGFTEQSKEDLEKLGLSGIEEDTRDMFEGTPTKTAVYLNQKSNNFGIIVQVVAYPMAKAKILELAAGISSPDIINKEIVGNLGVKNAVIKPEYSGIGDGSIGLYAEMGEEYNNLLLDMIISYRENAAFVLMFYRLGSTSVDLKSLAQTVDGRVQQLTK